MLTATRGTGLGPEYPGVLGIRTRPFTLLNRSREAVHGLLHQAPGTGRPRGTVLAVPGFSRTLHQSLTAAVPLLLDGFAVLRFDPTHAAGRSEGDISGYTFGSLLDDLLDVALWLHHRKAFNAPGSPNSRMGLLGYSAGGRVVVRAAALRPDLFGVVGTIAGAVDLRAAIQRVPGDAGQREEGPARHRTFFGHRVCVDPLPSMEADGWLDPGEAEREIATAAGVRFCAVFGDRDPWVSRAGVERAYRGARHAALHEIEGAGHELTFHQHRSAMAALLPFYRTLAAAPGGQPECGPRKFIHEDLCGQRRADRRALAAWTPLPDRPRAPAL